jgi:uncharacterized protein YbbC (DUF1343 family)
VIWEGTNISEGRGTTQPFELFGAPFLAPDRLMATLDPPLLSGVVLRPVEFEPTSNKWANRACKGFQLHVTDPAVYSSYPLSLGLYQAAYMTHPDRFAYKQPPYEYEYERLPMDLILGDHRIRSQIETGTPLAEMVDGWRASLTAWAQTCQSIHLYD